MAGDYTGTREVEGVTVMGEQRDEMPTCAKCGMADGYADQPLLYSPSTHARHPNLMSCITALRSRIAELEARISRQEAVIDINVRDYNELSAQFTACSDERDSLEAEVTRLREELRWRDIKTEPPEFAEHGYTKEQLIVTDGESVDCGEMGWNLQFYKWWRPAGPLPNGSGE